MIFSPAITEAIAVLFNRMKAEGYELQGLFVDDQLLDMRKIENISIIKKTIITASYEPTSEVLITYPSEE